MSTQTFLDFVIFNLPPANGEGLTAIEAPVEVKALLACWLYATPVQPKTLEMLDADRRFILEAAKILTEQLEYFPESLAALDDAASSLSDRSKDPFVAIGEVTKALSYNCLAETVIDGLD